MVSAFAREVHVIPLGWLDNPVVEKILRLLVIAALDIGITDAILHQSLARCLSDYNDRSALAAAARVKAVDQDWAALDTLFYQLNTLAALPPDQARAASRLAFESYVATRKQTVQARLDNPPPRPPSKVC
jgi:hypothetical protein